MFKFLLINMLPFHLFIKTWQLWSLIHLLNMDIVLLLINRSHVECSKSTMYYTCYKLELLPILNDLFHAWIWEKKQYLPLQSVYHRSFYIMFIIPSGYCEMLMHGEPLAINITLRGPDMLLHMALGACYRMSCCHAKLTLAWNSVF